MRFVPLVVLLAVSGATSAQVIVPDARGRGYIFEFPWSLEKGVDFDRVSYERVGLGFSRPLGTAAFPGRGQGTITMGRGGSYAFRVDDLPKELLGAEAMRISGGGAPTTINALLIPDRAVARPALQGGQAFLCEGILPPGTLRLPDNWPVPASRSLYRRLVLWSPVARGWSASLEGVGEVRLAGDPFAVRGLIPLAPEPLASRYVGREYWAYPEAVEALSLDGRVRGTARLDRRRVRVRSLARFWRGGKVILSGRHDAAYEVHGSPALWPALHPLVAVVEPAGRDDVAVTLARSASPNADVSAEELAAFAHPASPKILFIPTADGWHLDRCLSPGDPAPILRRATPRVREAIERGQPILGMTPSELLWTVGPPNDAVTREELEATHRGTWTYRVPSWWGSARFEGGRLVR